ncbi:phasin family protein [Burkholderiaceae bacterium DAT-1]|nr:phasin family protein [Burkholderiaceae bacterium DAT-1]
MAKKLSSLTENQLTSTIKDSAQQIWLAGLGAFAKAQLEGTKVFDALVKEGETIQKKTRKVADEKIADVTGKAVDTWDKLEGVFEARVQRALSSLGVPSRKDIDVLSKRVAELSALVERLTDAQQATDVVVKKAAAKPAAAKVVAEKVVAEKAAPVAKKPAVKKAAPKAVEPAADAPAPAAEA